MRAAIALADTVVRAVGSGDRRVMLKANHWHAPRWIRVWMTCATRGGDGWLWYMLGALLLFFGGEARFAAVAAALVAVGVGIAMFLWLKRRIGRQRPCALEPHCWYELLPPDQFSFPSGHTITACAVASALSLFYPDLALGLYFCAASVAISRVLLGMHFVSDVIAGAALGTALGYGFAGLAARLSGIVL
jgi:undecaprenyl-diphosphatase